MYARVSDAKVCAVILWFGISLGYCISLLASLQSYVVLVFY